MSRQPKYRIYATLLDAFGQLERWDALWEKYYGFSQEPPCSPEEFREKLERELVDKVNRVPFDSEAADRGTAFNEVVDALVEGRKPNGMEVRREDGNETYVVTFNGREHRYPVSLCVEVAKSYAGALTQKRVSALMETAYGDIELYGVIDELLPFSVHDIKTTKSYSVGKFKFNNQHLVYPYCLQQQGVDVTDFFYDVVVWDKEYSRYREHYSYVAARDEAVLKERVENFILWLEEHRGEITDKKIFGAL